MAVLTLLKTQLDNVTNIDKYELVIIGDLNLDCTDKQSDSYKTVNGICEELSITNLIQSPTRITYRHSAILDIILTNVTNIYKSGVINYNITDHLPVFMIKKRQKIQHKKRYVLGRTYTNYDKTIFQINLQNLDWTILYVLKYPNDAWKMSFKAIVFEANKMSPVRRFKVNYNRPEL